MIHVLTLLLLMAVQEVVPPSQPETGAIRGRIIDARTGAPLAGALVLLRPAAPARSLATTSGSDGSYAFTGLFGGLYAVEATGGEHNASHLPGGYSTTQSRTVGSTLFMLRQGESRQDVDITLERGAAVHGHILDDDGEPLMGIRVRLFLAPGGQPVSAETYRPTDDRGAFRIFGVRPGRYFVCADAEHPRAFREPPSGVRFTVPVATCYRSTASSPLGEEITLEKSDVAIDVRMPRLPTLQVKGTVLDVTGLPAQGAHVTLSRVTRGGGGVDRTAPTPSGQFAISNLTPGRYTLTATSGTVSSRGEFQWATQDLDLTTDAEHLILTMAAAAQVKGRVVFDVEAPVDPGRIAIQVEPATAVVARSGPPQAQVTSDLRFELQGLAGPYLIMPAALPSGWIVKEVRYRGADITDVPTEFRTGPDEIEVVLTRRPAHLSGRVLDAQGNPATGVRVLAIPAARAHWRRFTARGPSALLKEGRFTLQQRAGEYFVLAVSEDDYESLGPDVPFAMIERAAERISLGENEHREIDLRVVPLIYGR